MKKRIFGLLAILLFLFLFVQNSISLPKKQDEPTLSEVTVTTSDTHLLLFSVLENGFTDGILQGLHSGLPIHFTFFVELAEADKGWKDKSTITMQTGHIISYDTLKETYQVEIEESGKRLFTYDTLAKAKKAFNELNGLKVASLGTLKQGVPYSVRIRAELHKKTLPLGLHEVVPFVSWWDIKTRWHSLTFTL